jgi:putative ABC transport system permease protein
VWSDVRYGLRQLRRSPGFTAVAVVTLALGIGANTAIFSAAYAVLLRPFPYRDPDRLVIVWEQNLSRDWTTNIVSPANFLDWRRQNAVFTDMAAVDPTSFNLSGGGDPVEVGGELVTANLFRLLGVGAIRGRGLVPADDAPGSPPVAVVSYGLWQRRYGGDPGLIGRSIVLDGRSYPVVGVMPPGFSDAYTTFFQTNGQVWVSGLDLSDPGRENHRYIALARLKPGVTLARAQGEMDAIATRLEAAYPESKGWGVQVIGVRDQVVGYVRRAIEVLVAAVAFVLLIACANLASLLLSRASAREREVAIRAAMGASRARVVRQLLAESLLLAAAGGALGLLLARWGIETLRALAPADTPGMESAALDPQVLAFALIVTLATGMLFGLAPALGASRPDVNASLREGGRGSTEGTRSHRLRGALVASEIALAFVLVVGAALMAKTLVRLGRFDLGFDPGHVLTLRTPLRGPGYASDQAKSRFFQQVLARVEALPGVEAASVTSGLPIQGWSGMGFVTGDDPSPAPERMPDANYLVVAPHYFRVMGVRLREGRAFSEADTAQSPGVAIVNEELARRYWPGASAVGKRLRTGTSDSLPWLTVVGVAANVRTRGPDNTYQPELYVPHTQYPWLLSPRLLVVRSTGDPLAIAPAVRRELLALDETQPVSDIQPLDLVAGQAAAQRRFLMALLGAFAAMALVLAGTGIYGVLAYFVARRTHEIGIRVAIGAARGDVVRLVLAQGSRIALVGLGGGLAGALVLTRALATILFEVSPADPGTLVLVTLLLALVALLACYLPARRAARLDPISALRHE